MSDTERYVTGVLVRREGQALADELGARMLSTGFMEARLDEIAPDYSLVPDWRTSILITSKFEYRPGANLAICPRACAHCKMPKGAETLPPIRLVSSFAQHLEPSHTSVAIWDNTLMSTPRAHFSMVASALANFGRPVDIACGLMPSGVEEEELRWRLTTLAQRGVRLTTPRMECNDTSELGRFQRMLAHLQAHADALLQRRNIAPDDDDDDDDDAATAVVQCFAVVNTREAPEAAWQRLEQLEALDSSAGGPSGGVAGGGRRLRVQVEVVYFTPHNWYHERPFVNTAFGWSAAELRRFHKRWGGFLQNAHLARDDDGEDVDPEAVERSMADFEQQN